MMAPLPGVTPLKPGSCTLPLYGIEPALLDALTGTYYVVRCSLRYMCCECAQLAHTVLLNAACAMCYFSSMTATVRH
jgi:hypothetical protein